MIDLKTRMRQQESDWGGRQRWKAKIGILVAGGSQLSHGEMHSERGRRGSWLIRSVVHIVLVTAYLLRPAMGGLRPAFHTDVVKSFW